MVLCVRKKIRNGVHEDIRYTSCVIYILEDSNENYVIRPKRRLNRFKISSDVMIWFFSDERNFELN